MTMRFKRPMPGFREIWAEMRALLPRTYRRIRNALGPRVGLPEQLEAIRPSFDEAHYLAQNPDVRRMGVDPLRHYADHGWREGRNPTADFSTDYYLRMNPDIAEAGINPFTHYVQHGRRERREAQSYIDKLRPAYRPLVSVIVPNYNHARFLRQRLRSIIDQSYDHIELIILDDASTDDSRAVIEAFLEETGYPAQVIANTENSGNPFAQWARGFAAAKGELVWICESDDFCEPDFLAHLVPHFVERSVMIGFGRIQFCDAEGKPQDGMDGFRERSEPEIWHKPISRTAQEWFAGAFSVHNVVANVGGAVLRNQPVDESVWEQARQFKIAGDWYLYCHLLRGGKMVYDPGAIAYFRQHHSNTSATNFNKLYYYEECIAVHRQICRTWDIPLATREKFLASLSGQYRHFQMEKEHGPLQDRLQTDKLLKQAREGEHFVIALLGFIPGGGEVFPINLANALAARGFRTSLLSTNMSEIHAEMLDRVRRDIPVYCALDVMTHGAQGFLDKLGASSVHTHMLNCDTLLLLDENPVSNTPYYVTLHGSYDGQNRSLRKLLPTLWRGVDGWVYTADKNLRIFHENDLPTDDFSFIPNAMPRDTRPFPKSRAELGIAEEAIVFTLVARGIRQKGWRAAVLAFRKLRAAHPDRAMHLLLVGEGEATDRAYGITGKDEDITFLGYQSHVNGLYRLSDCVILPTRFDGESFPLCIIQALQEAMPVIATDIGQIRDMLSTPEGQSAGIILDNIRNSKQFFEALRGAMEQMLDPAVRTRLSALSESLAGRFDMDEMTDTYLTLYRSGETRR